MTQAIKVDLPQVNAAALDQKPETIRLTVKADGEIYWDDSVVTDEQLKSRLEAAAKAEPQPEVHMSADKEARYEKIAEVMGASRDAGLAKFGFVTNPSSKR